VNCFSSFKFRAQERVSVDPKDGAVVALVGGFDFFQSKFNRVTQARRQPGSGFKPFVYRGGVRQGLYTGERVMDAPIVIDEAGNGTGLEAKETRASSSDPFACARR